MKNWLILLAVAVAFPMTATARDSAEVIPSTGTGVVASETAKTATQQTGATYTDKNDQVYNDILNYREQMELLTRTMSEISELIDQQGLSVSEKEKRDTMLEKECKENQQLFRQHMQSEESTLKNIEETTERIDNDVHQIEESIDNVHFRMQKLETGIQKLLERLDKLEDRLNP